jgi:hypothetical protein
LGQFSKKYRTFNPKNCYYALKNMGLGFGIRRKPIPYPGVKKAPDPDPDPQHCCRGTQEARMYLGNHFSPIISIFPEYLLRKYVN